MLPIKKNAVSYRTLEEIRLRKEELANELQQDNEKFTTLWNQVFIKRENASKGDYVAGIISNSITAIDVFLLARKLMKSYGALFGKKTKKKK